MTQAEGPLSQSTILGLVAMALAVLVVANDFNALSIALSAMEQHFGADVTTVQWVNNGYALVFDVLIVTGGRLADMFGRRRIFFLGASLLAVFSMIGGFAPNVGRTFGVPGALTDALSWRWIFFVNLPIAAFAIFVAWRIIGADEAMPQWGHGISPKPH